MDFGNMPRSSSERAEHALEHEHHEQMLKFHVPFLDDYCVGISKNDVILLGAVSGAGKTALAKRVAQRNVAAGKTVYYFALEAEKDEIESRIAYELMAGWAKAEGQLPRGASYARWKAGFYQADWFEYERRARSELAEKYKNLYTYYKQGDFGLKDIAKEFLAVYRDADLLVLDHLHYVDLDDRNSNENAEYKRVIKTIRDLALEMDTPVLLVAHLRKKQNRGAPTIVPELDDFHGSSDLVKVATRCVVLAPAYDESSPAGLASTYLWVAKDRRVGITNYVAKVSYDLATNDYLQGYQLGKKSGSGTEWTETRIMDIPAWADGAIRPKPSGW